MDTVKRTCFKKLPQILAIQLKRFDYDWERETPIKFNDYFEFPRELDMEPYTVQGLAKAEGTIDHSDCSASSCSNGCFPLSRHVRHRREFWWWSETYAYPQSSRYALQTSGHHCAQWTGQWWSLLFLCPAQVRVRDRFVLCFLILCECREEADASQWYKFDDTDVSECKMDDDEEIRSQCFGGDYPAQSFDQPVMKR